MTERKTAGELTLKCRSDNTIYDPIEIGHALVEDESVERELYICAERHREIFDEEEYCVGYVTASDPLIKGVMRRKFFAMLYLPSPRPQQGVFLYNKVLGRFTKRLWILPNAATMEKLYVHNNIPKKYETMQMWSRAFYDGIFWPFVRHQHGINLLSEHEYLNVNREKLIQACSQDSPSSLTESLDPSQINIEEIVDSGKSFTCQNSFDSCGQT